MLRKQFLHLIFSIPLLVLLMTSCTPATINIFTPSDCATMYAQAYNPNIDPNIAFAAYLDCLEIMKNGANHESNRN